MSDRWTGLKGKPQSSDMRFLLRTHGHRFPGVGYNTFHDRVMKEERGYQRLVRYKINELFSSPDDNAALEAAQRANSSSASSNFGRVGDNNSARNGGSNYYFQDGTTPLSSAADQPTTSIMSQRPQTAMALSPRRPVNGTVKMIPTSGAGGSRASSTADPFNKLMPPRPDSQAGKRTLLVASDGLAHLEAAKMATLTEMNRKRLANIWPLVAEGWDAPEVQKTLRTVGRDCEGSPLRTLAGASRPASATNARSSYNNNTNNNNNNFSNADRSASVEQQQLQQQQQQSPRNTHCVAPSSNNNNNNNNTAPASSAASSSSVYTAYNRRIRAPAISQPFLGKRGTAQQREAESTSVLLRKLADLEREIRSQQGNRAEMQLHVQELKAILLNQSSESRQRGTNEEQQQRGGGGGETLPLLGEQQQQQQHEAATMSAARNQYYAPGARELRNVKFAN